MSDLELESFKRLSLPDYAASIDYVIDKGKSSRGSLVMRHGNGDKIIITRQADGHYTYWSPRDDGDHGTIIDFVRHRFGMNLGQIRKRLRNWTGAEAAPGAPARPYLPELQSTPKDRKGVGSRYALMRVAHSHPYLENQRGIPALALQYWRFNGRIRIDGRGNTVFPHFDTLGLCGYELKNRRFTGFASGGSKGLWLSKAIKEDNRLVICESAIEALSYYVLFPDGNTRFASLGGKMNRTQPGLIRAEIHGLPQGSGVCAAMNNDEPGRQLAEAVRKEFEATGRPDLTFSQEQPEGVNDWNDLLRATRHSKQAASPRPEARPA
jgi:hypothetical protein